MKLPDITYKQVLDSNGGFVALEIWQDGKYITISTRVTAFGDGPSNNSNWDTMKQTIDDVVTLVQQHAVRGVK